jgi:hypothetical protein
MRAGETIDLAFALTQQHRNQMGKWQGSVAGKISGIHTMPKRQIAMIASTVVWLGEQVPICLITWVSC